MSGTITYTCDAEARILTIAFIGEVSDAQALREIPLIWQRHPEMLSYDCLIDASGAVGVVSWDATSRISEDWHGFAAERDDGARTAIVIQGEMETKIAAATAVKFPNRQFAVFGDVAAARAWLLSPGRRSPR